MSERRRAELAGGMGRMPETPAEMPDVWSIYLATDDAEKTVDTAKDNGPQVIAPNEAMPAK